MRLRPSCRSSGPFILAQCRDRQRMDPALELLGQRLIDHSVPLDAGFTFEGCGDYSHVKMRLSPGTSARMSRMPVAVVPDFQLLRRKGFLKLVLYGLLSATRMHFSRLSLC